MLRRSPIWSDPRVKPPYGSVEIDRGHPLAHGLRATWLLNEGAGGPRLLGDVAPVSGTLQGAVWAPGPVDAVRVGLQCSSNAYATTGTVSGLSTSINSVTFVSIFDVTAALGSFKALFMTRTAAVQGMLLSSAAGNPLAWIWQGTGTDFGAATGLTLSTGQVYLGATVIAPSTTTMYLVPLGGSLQSYDSGVANDVHNINGEDWAIGADTADPGTRSWPGRIYSTSLYEKTLTSGDILRFAGEPYAFLRPIIRRRYFVPAAVGVTIPRFMYDYRRRRVA